MMNEYTALFRFIQDHRRGVYGRRVRTKEIPMKKRAAVVFNGKVDTILWARLHREEHAACARW